MLEGREGEVMMEVLPLTLAGMAGRGCDSAGPEKKGGERREMHCGGIVT